MNLKRQMLQESVNLNANHQRQVQVLARPRIDLHPSQEKMLAMVPANLKIDLHQRQDVSVCRLKEKKPREVVPTSRKIDLRPRQAVEMCKSKKVQNVRLQGTAAQHSQVSPAKRARSQGLMAPMVAAAQALLQFLTENQADGADNVGVGVVNHNGIRTRALTASKALQKGDVVLTSSPAHVLHRQDVHGRRFEGCNDDACKVALYIAEQRAQASKDVASIDPYWQKAMSTFPSFSDFESLGMPLAASEKALTVLSQIPELQTFVHFIRHTRGTMLSAVDFYNRNSESHLSFADALWGRLVAESSVESSCGLHVAPVADWVNHSRTPNVSYHCDDGNVTLSALQSISPGHELQAEYNQSGPLANFARYGIIEDASSTKPLSPSSCTRLQLLSPLDESRGHVHLLD
eukprot:symbB.v1.2.027141.t1/scaffold2764.1/size72906/8